MRLVNVLKGPFDLPGDPYLREIIHLLKDTGRFLFLYPEDILIVVLAIAAWIFPIYHWWGERRYRSWRFWIFVALSVTILWGILWYFSAYGLLPSAFEPDKIGILITKPSNQPRTLSESLYRDAILDRIKSYPELRRIVAVESMERPLPADPVEKRTEVSRIANWVGASFIVLPHGLRGVARPVLIVSGDLGTAVSDRSKGFVGETFVELREVPLPRDPGLLAEAVTAFALAKIHLYEPAALATETLMKSSALSPDSPSRAALAFLCGNYWTLSGNPERGLAGYEYALKMDPGFAEAELNMGNALMEIGRYLEALAAFDRANQFKPHNPLFKRDIEAAVHAARSPAAEPTTHP